MAAVARSEPESRPTANGPVTISTLAMLANGRSVMGISQYDLVAKGRPAWNAGKQSAPKERSRSSKSG